MTALCLHALYRYPVKSLPGQALPHSALTTRGLLHDRRWMLVDAAGQFITQRSEPRLALLRVQVDGEENAAQLHFGFPGGENFSIAAEQMMTSLPIRVWSDSVAALTTKHPVNEAFSDYLGQPVQLVFMPPQSRRAVDPAYAAPDDIVSFADGFPLLVTSTASLAAVSALCGRPLDIRRFRPNLVIDGGTPWQEENWRGLQVGDCRLDLVKPCTRCVLTTIDPDTGIPDADREPLQSLMRHKRGHQGVVFGMNAILRSGSRLQVGDAVQILK